MDIFNNFRQPKRYSWKDYVGPYEIRIYESYTREVIFSKPINIFRGEFLFDYTGLMESVDYQVPYATDKYLDELELGTITFKIGPEYSVEVLFNTTDLINFWKSFPIYNLYGEFAFGSEWSEAINYYKQENLGLNLWDYPEAYLDDEKITETPFMKDLPKDKTLKAVITTGDFTQQAGEYITLPFNPQPIASLYDGVSFFYIQREIGFTVNIK